MPSTEPLRLEWRPALEALGEGARFLTRLPLPFLPEARGDIASVTWTFPLIGALVGLASGLAYLIATELNLGVVAAAFLAVTASVMLTGALHEDGLADTADGFGGGSSRTAKLDIMRDSRLGTYGALALILSIGMRVGAILSLAPLGAFRVLLMLVAAEAAARAGMVYVWQRLPAARVEGLSAAAGQPDDTNAVLAYAIAAVLIALTALPGAGFLAALTGSLAAAAAAAAFTRLCRVQIGGQTGDALGAGEQAALAAFLLIAAAFARPAAP